ncbi:MAG: hypothetical protein L3J22_09885 [Xanthomonadales bacterium]|nr:hypothetical protein [Xanthomonadales bacterium]
MDQWNSMLSRAWSASQKAISTNSDLQLGVAHSDMILSVIFEGNLSTEALTDYAIPRNTGSNSYQCISPYNTVNIARELGIVRLLGLDSNLLSSNSSLTKGELWAAWLIVLHADIHPKIQERFEPTFTQFAQAGKISGYNIALLSGRISLEKKEALKYGVLYDCAGGKISHSLEDISTVNARRKAINMQPYENWLAEETLKAKCE